MEVSKYYMVNVEKSKVSICKSAVMATGMVDRMIGLMFQKSMEKYDGLLINPCNQIHTFFMRFSIDLIFLNKKNEIVKIVKDKKPWGMSLMYFRASKVLEIKAGSLNPNISLGDKVEFICIN